MDCISCSSFSADMVTNILHYGGAAILNRAEMDLFSRCFNNWPWIVPRRVVYPLITYCWCRWSRILIFGDFFYNRYDNFISLSELFSVAKERVKSGCAYKSEKSEIEFWRFQKSSCSCCGKWARDIEWVDVFKVLVKMVIIIFHISWFCITFYLHLRNESNLYVGGYWSLLWALLTNDNGQWGWAKEVKILCVVPQEKFIPDFTILTSWFLEISFFIFHLLQRLWKIWSHSGDYWMFVGRAIW